MNKQMVALCSILCLCSLFLAGQILANGTYNKRQNTEHAPISFDTKTGDTPYVIEIKNGIGEAGARVLGIDSEGKPLKSWKANWLLVDTAVEAEARSIAYDTYLIDTVGFAGYTTHATELTGISFYLPAGSAALDGFRIKFIDISSTGTTETKIVPADDVTQAQGITDYIFGYMNGAASGATATPGNGTSPVYAGTVLNAAHEVVEYVYRYAVAGGTWYQINRN